MGTQLFPKGVQQPPLFGPCLLWTNGWMDQDMLLGTEVGFGPGHIVLDGSQLPRGKGTAAPTFRPMSIVAKQSPMSATAELLFRNWNEAPWSIKYYGQSVQEFWMGTFSDIRRILQYIHINVKYNNVSRGRSSIKKKPLGGRSTALNHAGKLRCSQAPGWRGRDWLTIYAYTGD